MKKQITLTLSPSKIDGSEYYLGEFMKKLQNDFEIVPFFTPNVSCNVLARSCTMRIATHSIDNLLLIDDRIFENLEFEKVKGAIDQFIDSNSEDN
ncbi:hypothetical protein HCG83_06375 [Enterococcus casseliflavus]|uniref:hypothetical protein n=1 Tax=Enterococcus casseliflavus TaxID=37734 RepID=UPI001C8C9C74|nr:hypothetical protein [Enterococcus casseliflavus]MBX9115935.1 hypothetical protein [Enterococcus casseliflavus]MBX9126335.1 hypothetical protein [Enterococcus casseliflavus]